MATDLRPGMNELIRRWQRMVNDSAGSVWTVAVAQDILDAHRMDFYQEPLAVTGQEISGSVHYKVYNSQHHYLEGTASGTVAFRLYDSNGTVLTTGYTLDLLNGQVVFSVDQRGSVRYLDGRSYDLNGAAADAWRERMGMQAENYDFRQEGRQFSRSQWFEHCEHMAEIYERKRRPVQAVMERGDMV